MFCGRCSLVTFVKIVICMSPSDPVDPDSVRSARLMLAFAVVSGGLLMIVDRPNAPLVIDEHVSYWIAGPSNPGTLTQRSLDYAATPPASALLQRAALMLGGNEPAVLRAVSWAAFVLAIVVVYFIGVKLDGPLAGGLAACVLAWHPEIVDVMRLARPYALSVLFATCSIWVTLQWTTQPRSRLYPALFVAVNAALVWTHYLNAPLVVVEFLVVAVPWLSFGAASQNTSKNFESPPSALILLAVVGMAVSVIPLVPSLLRILDWAPYYNFFGEPPDVFEVVGPFWWMGIPAGVMVAIVIRSVTNRPQENSAVSSRRPFVVLIVLGFVPVLIMAVASHLSQPALGEMRYRVVYAPAGALLFAVLVRRFARPLACFSAVTVGLTLAWWWSGDVPWKSRQLSSQAAPDWKKIAEHVNQSGHSGEPLFVHSGLNEARLTPAFVFDPLFMDYVSCRLGRFIIEETHPRYALPWAGSIHQYTNLTDFYRMTLAQSYHSRQDVWLAVGTDTDLGRDMLHQFREFANSAGFHAVKEYHTSTVLLVRFRAVEAN
jgi:hypothetical protein